MAKGTKKLIVVTGDITIDWNLARLRNTTHKATVWNPDDTVRACRQCGGVALLADVIDLVAQRLNARRGPQYEVRRISLPREPVQPGDDRFHHSYAMWAPYPYSNQQEHESKWVWRVEEFLGLDSASEKPSLTKDWRRVKNDPGQADLVVLDDAALGLRDRPQLWPKALTNDKCQPWVLVKMARPVAQGDLWQHLVSSCAERLIMVIGINDLRRTEVQISRELSWERTAQDLFWELTHNPKVNALSRCRHVIISCDTAGALLLSRSRPSSDDSDPRASWDCKLFFDPSVVEGMWQEDYPGCMIGYTTCLTAGIARQLMLAGNRPRIETGIQSGLAAMRKLHVEGYGVQDQAQALNEPSFPAEMIAAELTRRRKPMAVVSVQDPAKYLYEPSQEAAGSVARGYWAILDDLCAGTEKSAARSRAELTKKAEDIVVKGPERALEGVPLGRFAKLLTADRHEIEGYRSIRALVGQYCKQRQRSPLCIGVFGPPGSGKSFGVEQVAKSVQPELIEVCSFNLSQFNNPSDLVGAFHQVRDIGLSGKIPLVFWDEFDTTFGDHDFGWLRHFLAPMQDGAFQDGQVTHHIGCAIFVFAGGTRRRIEDFTKALAGKKLEQAKGSDFVSRLKGFVNIMGPDPGDETGPDGDPHYLIRRAILLRALLERNAPQIFDQGEGQGTASIDPGVLRGFLHIRRYKHGVRSMEAIITMSALAERNSFGRSHLPSEEQLDLHVDGLGFLSLVQSPELDGELLEELAKATHQVFCESQKGQKRPARAARVAYEKLSEDLKSQNREYVKDIITKVDSIGYVLIPARSTEPPFGFPGGDLESLAEMEHDRWLVQKVAQGWKYGPKRNARQKTNPALLPWRAMSRSELEARYGKDMAQAMGTDELPDHEKAKDRKLITGIPKILAKAGYTIVKLREN